MHKKRLWSIKLWGFSLVELMAAVAIVGILATLALPRFRLFVARSRMAEAKANLGMIAKLEQSYFAEYQRYNVSMSFMGRGGEGGLCSDAKKKNELGFRVTDCTKLRYAYGVGPLVSDFLAGARSGSSPATQIYPNCRKLDAWSITKIRHLTHSSTENVIKTCHE